MTCVPASADNEFPRPDPDEPPAASDGAGGTTWVPPPGRGLARPIVVAPFPSTDGAGGTTFAPPVANGFTCRPSAELPLLPIAGAGGTALTPPPDMGLPRPSARVPEPPTEGGGGTTAADVPGRPSCVRPGIVCCSCIGNSGDGATASEWPMFTSPTRRMAPCTVGGGATTAELGAPTARRSDPAPTSGAGATADACGKPSRRVLVSPTSGDGATAALGPGAMGRRECPVADSGMAGRAGFEAAIFEARLSDRPEVASLRSGGRTRLCALRSGATTIFC